MTRGTAEQSCGMLRLGLGSGLSLEVSIYWQAPLPALQLQAEVHANES